MGADTGSGPAASACQPSRPSSVLSDGLLIQLRTRDVGDFAELAKQHGSGLVLSGSDALDGVTAVRHHQIAQPFLIDQRRYAGNKRVRGNEPFSGFWLSEQRRLGAAAVLTDSGYIGEQDLSALRSVLAQTAAYLEQNPANSPAGGVWAVLPLHQRWLRDDVVLLTAEINRYGVPVALALEHAKDPLGTKIAVAGLTQVLAVGVPVALLSTDTSALGALAFGAAWTAVGVRSSLRHLYPMSDGEFAQGGAVSVLMDPILTIVQVEKIAAAYADSPDEDVWRCHCPECGGRALPWLLTADPLQAGQHTFTLLQERRDGLMSLPPGPQRRESWRAKCTDAIWQYDALGLVDRYRWEAPGFLKAWQAA